MVKVEKRLAVDHVKLLAKGIRCSKYGSVQKLLRAIRSAKIAPELSEDLEKEGPVYLVNYRGYKIIVLPDHVHVIGASPEEAKKIVDELEAQLK